MHTKFFLLSAGFLLLNSFGFFFSMLFLGKTGFQDYSLDTDYHKAEALAPALGSLYIPGEGWPQLNDLISRHHAEETTPEEMALYMNITRDRLIILKADGGIGWKSPLIHEDVSFLEGILSKRNGYPLTHANETVGYLFLGNMILEKLNTVQQDFLQRVFVWILQSFAVNILLVYWISTLFIRRTLRPLDKINVASLAIIQGNWAVPLPQDSTPEISRVTQAFDAMRTHLIHTEESRSKTLEDLTHELKTPLALMKGELEAILEGVYPLTMENLHSLKEETERLETVLSGLLRTSSDLEENKIVKKPIEARQLLRDLLLKYRGLLRKEHIRLETECPYSGRFRGDSFRLMQVFANLIQNTLVHGKTVENIRISCEASGEILLIRYENDGCPIPEDTIPFLFQRLFQVNAARKKVGDGIGLYIIQGIVEAHGGTVAARNKIPPPGVCFTIELPLR